MYRDDEPRRLGPAGGGTDTLRSLDNLMDDPSDKQKASQHRKHKRYPDPINSDITRDHWLEMPGCYDRLTCLPVHQNSKKSHQDRHGHHGHHAHRQDYHECLKTWKYAQYHDECCFFHSLGALEGGENKSPEGCTRALWPEDTRYYEGRQNYAQE